MEQDLIDQIEHDDFVDQSTLLSFFRNRSIPINEAFVKLAKYLLAGTNQPCSQSATYTRLVIGSRSRSPSRATLVSTQESTTASIPRVDLCTLRLFVLPATIFASLRVVPFSTTLYDLFPRGLWTTRVRQLFSSFQHPPCPSCSTLHFLSGFVSCTPGRRHHKLLCQKVAHIITDESAIIVPETLTVMKPLTEQSNSAVVWLIAFY